MTDGQARVLMLLILLALLEAGVQPGVRSFFKIVYSNISTNVGVTKR